MSITPAAHIMHALRSALPPPIDRTPEALDARDQAASAHYIALAPGDIAETQLAVLHVATCAQALDCLRLASLPDASPEDAFRHRHQALAMVRASQAALRALRAAQRERTGQTQRPPATSGVPLPSQPMAPPARTPAPKPPLDPITAAEAFARQFPTRAARIRRAGGMPPEANYEAPAPEVIQALVTGSTKHLRRLDRLAG